MLANPLRSRWKRTSCFEIYIEKRVAVHDQKLVNFLQVTLRQL